MTARRRASWTRGAVLTLAVLLSFLMVPGIAKAHALLVSSTPPPGARLGTTPGLVVLRFSEPLVSKLSVALVTDPTGHRFSGQVSGTQIVVFLTTNAPGPYTAMWTSVSAEDGHTVRGSLGFTVVTPSGTGSKSAVSSSPGPPIALGLFRTVQYAALLLAVGILLTARLARRRPELPWVQVRRLLPWVLAVALLAGVIVVSAEASAASNNASFRGLGKYLSAGLPGTGRIVLLSAEVFALLASLVPVAVWPFLLAALVGLAVSGHGASVGPAWWGVTVDAGHLVSAGLWAGGIMALATLRPPGGFRGEEGRRLLERFSPVAVTAFLGTVALGIIQGFQDVGSWHGLLATTYGRVLIVKAALVAAMVPLSMLAWRRRVAPRFEGVVAVFVIGAAALLASYPLPKSSLAQLRVGAPPVAATSPPPSSARVTSALPAQGDLTLGDHAGQILVGLTVRPARPGVNQLLVYLLPLQGSAARIPVRVSVDGNQEPVQVCGADCRVSQATLHGGEQIRVTADVPTGGNATFDLPRLPAPDGTAMLQKAQQRMHALDTFRLGEMLNSGLASVHATYAFEAPDRMQSVVSEGGNVSQVVYIGDTRYLQEQPGARWQVQRGGPSIPVPSFIWDYFKPFLDPRIIGTGTMDGVSTTVVAFSGGGPSGLAIWFRLWIDDRGLVRQAHMRAIGHFMDHRYFDFDAPFTISAPTS